MKPPEHRPLSPSKNQLGSGSTLTLTLMVIATAFYLVGFASAADRNSVSSASVSMLSRGQTYEVAAGGKLSLDCEFHMDRFLLFDNPTIWEKVQREERTRVNMAGVVQEPFATTRRFHVELVDKPPRYRMRLTLKETAAEDSGNYTCEVRGRKSMVLGKVTHTVYVRGPLTSFFLTSDLTPSDASRPLANLTVKDGHAVTVSCVSRGPCPSGEMTLQAGDTDLTQLFQRHQPVVKVTGVEGLRVMECTTWRSTQKLVLREYHDGKYLRCLVGHRQGTSDANATHVRIYVHYAPRIRCNPSHAQLGDRDVYIECSVWSRPELTVLYWVIDANGTTVSSDEVINEYWTMVTVKEEGHLVTKLFTRVVKSDTFRKYTLFSENGFGTTSYVAELQSVTKHQAPVFPKRTLIEERSSSSSSSFQRKFNSHVISFNAVSSSSSSSFSMTSLTFLTFLLLVTSVLQPARQRYASERDCCHSDGYHGNSCHGDHCRDVQLELVALSDT